MVYSCPTKKIVTHCSTVHPRKDTRIFYKMCLSLKKIYTINLIIADGKDNQILENINIYDIGKSNNRFTRIFKSFFIFPFKAISIYSDIYHIHDPELIPAGLILKLLNKKVIYDIHESYSEDILNKFWIPLFIRNIVSKLFNNVETFATSIFDLNICATDYIKSNIKYNSVTINNYPILSKQKETELPINFDNYFIYVGAISIQRGIIEIIDACIRCNQKLILCGTCENEFIHQIINKYQFKNENIIYYGQVENDFAYKLMKHAISGFLLFHPGPNHNNSLPNKMFEYMANGLPVICTNFPLWKSIIENNDCGICINPYEVESIDEAILSFVSNCKMRITYKLNCLKTINNYNWESQETILFREYEKLIA